CVCEIGGRAAPAAVDVTTAGLLGDAFKIDLKGDSRALRGERDALTVAPPRLVVGQASPFAGREEELAALRLVLDECAERSAARAVLVTGPVGAGKSRLCHELVRHVYVERPDAEVWVARGDPSLAGAPFATIGRLVRSLAGALGVDSLRTRRRRLTSRLGESL